MTDSSITLILNLGFLVLIGIFALISLLGIFVLLRYGRTRSISLLISAIFGSVFVLQTIAAFATLQTVF